MNKFNVSSFFYGLLTGGSLLKIVELLIAWRREQREQRTAKTSREKDRPRFRVDTSIPEPGHPQAPTIIVKIFSLGGLPLTINDGYIEIETIKYPGAIKPYPLAGKDISIFAPIEAIFKIRQGILNNEWPGESSINLICKFSYGENEAFEKKKVYNRSIHNFEDKPDLH